MSRILCLLALLLASAFMPARAEIAQCINITSLPATISTQGIYCLKQDLSTSIASGSAITINANNVTLDCNDWKIGGLGAGLTTNTNGISADNKLNTTIRNCGVRGFYTGINMTGGAGHLIEDNRIDQSTVNGINLIGEGNIVRHNRIIDTGGRPNSISSAGINITSSYGVSVTDNTVINVTVTGNPNGNAFGLYFGGTGHEIARNLFSNILPMGAGFGAGTYGQSSAIASLRDNTAINATAVSGAGVDGGSSLSQCKGNTVHGFSIGLQFCVDVAGNSSN